MMDEVRYGERVWIEQAEDWVTDLIKRMEMALVRCLDTIGALCISEMYGNRTRVREDSLASIGPSRNWDRRHQDDPSVQ